MTVPVVVTAKALQICCTHICCTAVHVLRPRQGVINAVWGAVMPGETDHDRQVQQHEVGNDDAHAGRDLALCEAPIKGLLPKNLPLPRVVPAL